jgi:hypothetical protein
MSNIEKCRICKNSNLITILDLGNMTLTGVFPKTKNENLSKSSLKLVKCHSSKNNCGLLQLKYSFDPKQMYGVDYGYKSSLNPSMVLHLQNHVKNIMSKYKPKKTDLILDIGSNDGTTLKQYPRDFCGLIGIDPTGIKFKELYPTNIKLISDFFSEELFQKYFQNQKPKIITSLSMFYDLEAPLEFMKDIYNIIDDKGVWIFEQSYMPSMLKQNSYDTICHEHLEFYSIAQIKWMTDKIGFNIIDINFFNINGGSFILNVSKRKQTDVEKNKVDHLIKKEKEMNLSDIEPYLDFKKNIHDTKVELLKLLNKLKSEGKSISAIGASTKGNVILQYCGIGTDLVDFVGEINSEKFGSFTPGTLIPIINEDELLEKKPDYLLILTWHFEDYFLKHKKFNNFKLIFPLPNVKVV